MVQYGVHCCWASVILISAVLTVQQHLLPELLGITSFTAADTWIDLMSGDCELSLIELLYLHIIYAVFTSSKRFCNSGRIVIKECIAGCLMKCDCAFGS